VAERRPGRWWAEHDLTVVLTLMFVTSWIAQALVGNAAFADDARSHGDVAPGFGAYLLSAHFWSATFENWESEFLQLAVYVILTIFLGQRGSKQSRHTRHPNPDVDTVEVRPDSPWPVRAGGWIRRLYENSLSIVLVLLFVGSFLGHALASHAEHGREDGWHGEPSTSFGEFLGSSQLWFESFQNWQSEFLSVLAMATLTIWLRQRGSPESKPVGAPHDESGE
jgi:hypothetical protein